MLNFIITHYIVYANFLHFQWEFQVGPLPGIQTADQVLLARYILVRLAEIHNVKISFRNIDCARHTNARQTFHLNFSTKNTRAEGGIKFVLLCNIRKHNTIIRQ